MYRPFWDLSLFNCWAAQLLERIAYFKLTSRLLLVWRSRLFPCCIPLAAACNYGWPGLRKICNPCIVRLWLSSCCSPQLALWLIIQCFFLGNSSAQDPTNAEYHSRTKLKIVLSDCCNTLRVGLVVKGNFLRIPASNMLPWGVNVAAYNSGPVRGVCQGNQIWKRRHIGPKICESTREK